MSVLAILLLLVLAWFFAQTGAAFIGFLCLVVAVILALASAFASKPPAQLAQGAAPAAAPSKGGKPGEEEFGNRMGEMANFFAYIFKGIASWLKMPQKKEEEKKADKTFEIKLR